MEENEFRHPETTQSLAKAETQAIHEQVVLDASPEEIWQLPDYWRIIVKRRWVVLTCLLVVFSTIAIGTLKQKAIYQGKVVVEINPEQPNVLNFKEVLQVSTVDVDSYRETQYKILQSRTLAERVTQTLQLYKSPEFYQNRWPFGLIETDPAKIPSASDPGPPDTSADYYRNSVKHFLDAVDIAPVRRSNLVEVSFYSEDPRVAARVANQLAADYIDQNLQVKWDETVKASEWLQDQLVGLKAKLEKSEDSLQAYAQANSILFVEEKKNLVNERLAQLQEAYTKAQADRFQKESSYSLVQAGKVQDLPGFLSNRLIQDLSVRLSELERDYSQLTATVKPDYPKAVALKREIDTVQLALDRQKGALAQNIVDEYRSAVANEKYLAGALEQQKKEVNEIAEKSIQYNILKREVDTSKQLYEGLLQRLKEAQVSAGLKASNIRIVDAAEVPKRPVKPRVVLNLALGVILGLGLGMGLAFFQEYLDNTLKTPDEVETLLRLPSLGVVPVFSLDGADKAAEEKLVSIAPGMDKPIGPAIQTNPAAVEAFRSLRTSILLSANPVPKILLITSALPGEGKTTVAANLGATLASLGSKVLILDCDMRRPACHRATGVKNSPGFVQCLTGHAELGEAVLPVPGVENLSVIPCGPIPPNPAEVLSSTLAGELLRRLRGEFEYVLVDSPPLLSVADSRILVTLTDAVVLVVRAYETPYDVVRRARSLLYGAGARILGVALNDVDIRKDGYAYNYYYRYGHGYGYGYEPGTRTEGKTAHHEET
ncbi:MAG: polysaccharide biosynthesis tyrosine autokinase [Acidobacteriia bacterium]|nr:polysaccharide biosynthesis tyrosine autokinase [Terriglobia bacterium]